MWNARSAVATPPAMRRPAPAADTAAGTAHLPRPVPAELAGWTRYETPPDIVERARREFDEAEYLAEVREVERTGGVQIDDLIAELERRVDGGT